MSAEEMTIATYDQIASSYADRYWNMSLDQPLHQFIAAVKSGGTILDLGCGPGRDVALFKREGFHAIGIDRSLGMLQEARRRVTDTDFACADMRRIPLAAQSLDGIWMCASLLHIPRPDVPGALSEVRRVLRIGGAVYLSVRQGEGEEWSDSDGGRRCFTLFQADEIHNLVTQSGISVQHHSVDAFGHSTWISILGKRQE